MCICYIKFLELAVFGCEQKVLRQIAQPKLGQIAAEMGQSTSYAVTLIVIFISLLLLSGWIVMAAKYVHILYQISRVRDEMCNVHAHMKLLFFW